MDGHKWVWMGTCKHVLDEGRTATENLGLPKSKKEDTGEAGFVFLLFSDMLKEIIIIVT